MVCLVFFGGTCLWGNSVVEWIHGGQAAFESKNYSKAESCFAAAIREMQSVGRTEIPTALYVKLAESGFLAGHLRNAEKALQFCLSLDLPVEDHVQVLERVGELYVQTDALQVAFPYFRKAGDLYALGADTLGMIRMFGKCAHCRGSSQFTQTIADYQQALFLSRSLKNVALQAYFLNEIGEAHAQTGQTVMAYDYFSLALFRNSATDNFQLNGRVHRNLGDLYQRAGDFSLAKTEYLNAISIFQQQPNSEQEYLTLKHIADMFREQGDYQGAAISYDMALKTAENHHLSQPLEPVLLGKAFCLLEQRQIRQARILFIQVTENWQNTENIDIIWQGHLGLARVYEAEARYDKARTEYEKAYRIVNQNQMAAEYARYSKNAKRTLPLFENYIRLLLQDNLADSAQVSLAYQLMEQNRARSFREKLAHARILEELGSPEVDSLNLQRRWREQELFRLEQQSAQLPRVALAKEKRREVLLQQSHISSQIAGIDEKLARMEYDNGRLPQLTRVLSPAEIKKALRFTDYVLLEYFLSEPNSYVWAITKGQLSVIELPSAAIIREQIILLLNTLQQPNSRFTEFVDRPSRQLYQLLIAPLIENGILDQQQIVIVPDGELAFLPFEILQLPENTVANPAPDVYLAPRKYLIERNRIIYTPSASVFCQNGDEQVDYYSCDLMAVATDTPVKIKADAGPQNWPALNFAGEEISAVADFFPVRKRIVVKGADARESIINSGRSPLECRILHLATHGVMDPNYSQLSGLIMQADSIADGFLSVPEIYQLRLSTDLVVLSGCQTGLGPLYQHNGVESLARAFVFAGTPAVLVSLWKVDDHSTAVFMEKFYLNMIAKKQPVATALATAKIEMLESGTFSLPYFWAPFILVRSSH